MVFHQLVDGGIVRQPVERGFRLVSGAHASGDRQPTDNRLRFQDRQRRNIESVSEQRQLESFHSALVTLDLRHGARTDANLPGQIRTLDLARLTRVTNAGAQLLPPSPHIATVAPKLSEIQRYLCDLRTPRNGESPNYPQK